MNVRERTLKQYFLKHCICNIFLKSGRCIEQNIIKIKSIKYIHIHVQVADSRSP